MNTKSKIFLEIQRNYDFLPGFDLAKVLHFSRHDDIFFKTMNEDRISMQGTIKNKQNVDSVAQSFGHSLNLNFLCKSSE